MPDQNPHFADDMVRFATVAEMRVYIKKIHDRYQKDVDRFGAKAGQLMRERVEEESKSVGRAPTTRGNQTWQRMGSLLINNIDSKLGMNEINLQLLTDYKTKLKATADALRSFESVDQFRILPGSSLVLYLNEGVPARVVIEPPEPKQETPAKVAES